MIDKSANTERMTAACVLSIIGGFLDIYTYLHRGKVFANAVTGNLVLFGMHLAEFEWQECGKYLLAIMAYALGISVAEFISKKIPVPRRLNWHQIVLLLELLCLLPVCFVPYGEYDYAVNALVSFVCALQVQTFRKVHGLPFASTMCTGNLRSGSEAFFRSVAGGDKKELHKALRYYGVIVFFIFGAAAGAVLLNRFGHRIFLLAPAGLLAVFFLIAPHSERILWRRSLRRIFARRK